MKKKLQYIKKYLRTRDIHIFKILKSPLSAEEAFLIKLKAEYYF